MIGVIDSGIGGKSIQKEIEKIVGQDIKIIDSNKAVARQVKIIYDEINVKQ